MNMIRDTRKLISIFIDEEQRAETARISSTYVEDCIYVFFAVSVIGLRRSYIPPGTTTLFLMSHVSRHTNPKSKIMSSKTIKNKKS